MARSFARVCALRRATLAVCAMVLCAMPAFNASAQIAYPTKPIRIVVPFPPGGSTDFLARGIGQKLTEAWGQQVVIDNRAGAGGIVGTEIVAHAAPDGYNLLMNAIGHAANPALYKKLPYDSLRDFTPIILVADVPTILAAHSKINVTTVKPSTNDRVDIATLPRQLPANKA